MPTRIIWDVKQLVLELIPAPEPSFDNFVVGANQEARNALLDVVLQRPPAAVLYLWGVSGSGKSHSLYAVASSLKQSIVTATSLAAHRNDALSDAQMETPIIVVDDVERLDDAAQVALFNAINQRAQQDGSCVVVAGHAAPRDLPLRPELASRLGSGLSFQLHPLTDSEKAAALNAHATSRGFSLREEVTSYLLRHSRRDMTSLIAMLDALDQYSLETGREITLPLLKQISQPSLV